MNCKYCSSACVKAGVRSTGVQKFQCRGCKKYQQKTYRKNAYLLEINHNIVRLLIEGVSIRGIARVLKIAIRTVIQRIKKMARLINKPTTFSKNGTYEIDELWTYVAKKSNETWIMYIFDRATKSVIDFRVGSRTKVNLQSLTDQALLLEPEKICTDGLNIYRSLIPENVHRVGLLNTRHIERHNLNIRTHLKRLSRKTICFSRSMEMLKACLKIYFWRGSLIVV
jgi:IS1 family transposase/transposase-like protein